MSEYICELPFEDVESFESGNTQIPVREHITRCKDCWYFWPGVSDIVTDWCLREGGHNTTPQDFCSNAKPVDRSSNATKEANNE